MFLVLCIPVLCWLWCIWIDLVSLWVLRFVVWVGLFVCVCYCCNAVWFYFAFGCGLIIWCIVLSCISGVFPIWLTSFVIWCCVCLFWSVVYFIVLVLLFSLLFDLCDLVRCWIWTLLVFWIPALVGLFDLRVLFWLLVI